MTQHPFCIHIALGSQNAAKLSAVKKTFDKLSKQIPDWPVLAGLVNSNCVDWVLDIQGLNVPSGVSDQPMSDEETMTGAQNRAKAVLSSRPDAHLGKVAIGIEGGNQKIGHKWFESGWVAIMTQQGQCGLGTSGRFELSHKIVDRLLKGQELAQVMDDLSGLHDVRSNAGAMGKHKQGEYLSRGLLTRGMLNRDDAYESGQV